MLCVPEKVVPPFPALSSSGQGEMRVTSSTWYGASCMRSARSGCFIISEKANKSLLNQVTNIQKPLGTRG